MAESSCANVLVLATDGFEQAGLVRQLRECGVTVCLAAPDDTRMPGAILAWEGDGGGAGEWGAQVAIDRRLTEVRAKDFDALALPGGLLSPNALRAEPAVLALVRDFAAQGKPVAAIGHAAWILVDAGLAQGRRMTSCATIRTDLQNAGATWLDQPLVQDGGVITADAPRGLEALVAQLARLLRPMRPLRGWAGQRRFGGLSPQPRSV